MPNVVNDSPFGKASQQMSDGMARICRLYGVSPLVGRLYTALFLAAEPVSLESLCELVGVAKSTASVGLRQLERAKVVRRLPPRRDRRDFYEIVADPWSVFADWSKNYFSPELEMYRETTQAVLAALDEEERLGRAAGASEARAALRERLRVWRTFVEVISGVLGGVGARGTASTPARRIPVVEEDAS